VDSSEWPRHALQASLQEQADPGCIALQGGATVVTSQLRSLGLHQGSAPIPRNPLVSLLSDHQAKVILLILSFAIRSHGIVNTNSRLSRGQCRL